MRIHASELRLGARIRLSQSGPAQTVQHIAQMPENPRHLHVETDRRSLYLPKRRRVWLADRRVA